MHTQFSQHFSADFVAFARYFRYLFLGVDLQLSKVVIYEVLLVFL